MRGDPVIRKTSRRATISTHNIDCANSSGSDDPYLGLSVDGNDAQRRRLARIECLGRQGTHWGDFGGPTQRWTRWTSRRFAPGVRIGLRGAANSCKGAVKEEEVGGRAAGGEMAKVSDDDGTAAHPYLSIDLALGPTNSGQPLLGTLP